MTNQPLPPSLSSAIEATKLVCMEAGDLALLSHLRRPALIAAVEKHDTPALFDWMIRSFSFQGISDSIAAGYMKQHGAAAYDRIIGTTQRTLCGKLQSYWHYDGCFYHKGSHSCAEPELIDHCPLPSLNLRNGRLNQTAYSLALYLRDVVGGDLVEWVDQQLEAATPGPLATRPRRLAQSVIEPLCGVYGISDKVLNMTLSDLLLGGGEGKPLWLEAGGAMIAIDSLVHNWLHRIGALDAADCRHTYGIACYTDGGCRDLVEYLAQHVTASRFNNSYPPNFPRFVQKAIWSFCAQGGLARCNGITIDDRLPCRQTDCPATAYCSRLPLKL